MIIRKANEGDVPQIIKVLKKSLGDELPVSEQIWRYKHYDNPFGPSIVLIAEENYDIVGVRAFMRWEWKMGNAFFHTYRAVDTATSPDHRGKGIFKKLTLKAVEVAKEVGGDFIFNTPNDQSRPGYLKMGWERSGKIKVGITPSWISFWKLQSGNPEYIISHKTSKEELGAICDNWNSALASNSRLFTPKSPEYLIWRFEKNPLQKYEVFSEDGIYMAASVKKRRNFKELRIVESIFENRENNLRKAGKIIKKWSSKFGVQVISFSPELKQLGGPSFVGSFGPILTLRDLNLQISGNQNLANVEQWSYSLGDLELF
ncbi:GNAT family N-acetyltransferase [Salinimicrobium terrae]|uniref:GNAT family N-acetyltransferase n=1 Tax=Salinimicrobium terrae TaxID=470866 RepID=UPI0003FE72B2|nr:GNAT family N-acetyltransferase [Salinimicrobium terrae]